MNKRVSLGVTVAVAAVVAAIVLSLTMTISTRNFNSLVEEIRQREDEYEKISEIDTVIRENYNYDIDEEVFLDGIAQGVISGLGDPFCRYLTAEEYSKLQNQYTGTEVSIGVSVYKDSSGYIRIYNVYSDSPAEKAGIKKGDLIISIYTNDVLSLGYDNAVALLQGDVGSTVTLSVRRGSEEITSTMKRKKIDIPTVSFRMLDGNIGYVKITEFSEPTYSKFNTAVNTLVNDGAIALIFDVRGNKGGKLSVAAEMLDKLLPQGVIVSKTDKDDTDPEVIYTSDKNSVDLPMSVIVNYSTEKEAELFAAVLKDYNKATIIGTQTAGKGVVTETFKLTDGSAIVLTTGTLITPSGNTFNQSGIVPNTEVVLTPEEEDEFYILDEISDPQLAKAVENATSVQSSNRQ